MLSTYLVALLFCGLALTSAKGYKAERAPRNSESSPSSPAETVTDVVYGSSYNRFHAPGSITGESTTVQTGVYIVNLKVDEKSMTAKVVMYYRQSWVDARLQSTRASITRWFNSGALWLPDTFFRTVTEPIKVDHELMKIRSDGTVWFVQRVFATFMVTPASTAGDNSDNQLPANGPPGSNFVVPIIIESFGNTNDTLSLSALSSPIQFDTGNILESQAIDCSQQYTTGVYPCLEFRLYTAKRR